MSKTELDARLDRLVARTAEALCLVLEDVYTPAGTRMAAYRALWDCVASGRLDARLTARAVQLVSVAGWNTGATGERPGSA